MTSKDRVLAFLDADDIPAVMDLLLTLEKCGQLNSTEAAEWRRRLLGWQAFHHLGSNGRSDGLDTH